MTIEQVLDIGGQIASALAAAHEAHIIHRDIKPENVMLRRDGIVKVLDFGLAKLIEPSSSQPVDREGPTRALIRTDPGVVMGTVFYMSPEQARGFPVDARTDIFSLGVLLYEMVANRQPFHGASASDVISMILNKEPPALSLLCDEATDRLDEIVAKALAKDPEHRYQVIKDLLIDLRRLKQRIEFESEVERTSPTGSTRISEPSTNTITSGEELGRIAAAAGSTRASSAEYIATAINRHKKELAIAAVTIGLAIISGATYLWIAGRRPRPLTDKDTIVVADFTNTTGDVVFDDTLKQALAVQLEQSPFLNIFTDVHVRETLRFMNRSPDERVTKEIAREICERRGLKAYLSGSISNLGSHYVVTLEAADAHTGDTIGRQQVEAESKEQVIAKLGEATTKLREKLGESLATIQKYDAPIGDVTTSSLEALKGYTTAQRLNRQNKNNEAIPLYKTALELDPNFALAYNGLAVAYRLTGQPALAQDAAQKGFDLRIRVSEREKLKIAGDYYWLSTGELEKAVESYELLIRTYPRYFAAWNNLGFAYLQLGQFDKAIEKFNDALRLEPNGYPYSGLAGSFMRLNRFAEAKENITKGLAQNPDDFNFHYSLYKIAFLEDDTTASRQQVDWISTRPNAFTNDKYWQADAAAFAGELRKARNLYDGGIDIQRRFNKTAGSGAVGAIALDEAVSGNCQSIKADTNRALAIERSDTTLWVSALALAMCGETSQAQPLVDEVARRKPKDSLVAAVGLPVLEADIEIQHKNAARAIELLQPAKAYPSSGASAIDLDNVLWPEYLRGLAYLNQKQGSEAATEFQTLLDHRGLIPLDMRFPLAYLGLARSRALQGDSANARKAYQDFFALWKNADSDIPILVQAKKEYEQLK